MLLNANTKPSGVLDLSERRDGKRKNSMRWIASSKCARYVLLLPWSKWVPKSSQNRPQNYSLIDAKSSQNRSRIVPKSTRKGTLARNPIFSDFGTHFGRHFGPMLAPFSTQNMLQKRAENQIQNSTQKAQLWHRFGDVLEVDLGQKSINFLDVLQASI